LKGKISVVFNENFVLCKSVIIIIILMCDKNKKTAQTGSKRLIFFKGLQYKEKNKNKKQLDNFSKKFLEMQDILDSGVRTPIITPFRHPFLYS